MAEIFPLPFHICKTCFPSLLRLRCMNGILANSSSWPTSTTSPSAHCEYWRRSQWSGRTKLFRYGAAELCKPKLRAKIDGGTSGGAQHHQNGTWTYIPCSGSRRTNSDFHAAADVPAFLFPAL